MNSPRCLILSREGGKDQVKELRAAGGWSRRHALVALCFLASFIAYTDRVNISVAAVAMKEDLGWSQTEKGLVLSSFFVGYMLFMYVSGALARRYGGRNVLGLAVVAWSVFTLLTPPAAAVSIPLLVAARILMGVGEAAIFPASVELYSRWIPVTERTRAMAKLLSGIPMGTVVGLMATGWIVGRWHWSMAFYSFGVLGLGWAVIWFARISDDPEADPRITESERALIGHIQRDARAGDVLPFGHLLRVPAVWAMVAAHFATTWTLYVLISWLPSYFREAQGLSIANSGLFSAAPWLAMFVVTNAGAAVSDRMIRGGTSLTRTRKLMQCLGLVGSAAFLLAARDVHTPSVALALMCGAAGTLGLAWSGYAPNGLDISPPHAAQLMGMSNTIATIPGIVGVAVTGWLLDATGTYAAAFVLTAVVSGVGALAYATVFDASPIGAAARPAAVAGAPGSTG
jgi:MFS transporter, ACS family, solute carrier family 17 (sodium-dependent inorganic phosphate cotransporter), other